MSWPDDTLNDFATRYRDADDATLDQLEHKLHAMLAQITIIRDQRPRAAVVPTGDRHLPVELWSKIFVLCGPDGSSDWETACHSESDFPVILSLVSKDWQEIALITSQIWSKIAIIPYSRSFSTKRATLWLSRAKSTPLQIYLHASTLYILSKPLSEEEKEQLLLDALDFVAENIHRCERLGVFEDRRDQFIAIMSRLRRPAPILTHFRLRFIGFESVAGVDDAVREEVQPHIDELFANHSPMLSTARLISFAILWPLSALRNLITLHVASGGPVKTARLLGILGDSPALKTVSFSAFRLSTEAITHFNTPVFTHRSLQNFTIRCDSTADALAVLEKLDLPALRSLTVDSSEVSGMAGLSNIIAHSQFALLTSAKIRLQGRKGGGRLIHLFARMKSLLALEITDLDIIQYMSATTRELPFPLLTDLTILPLPVYTIFALKRDLIKLIFSRGEANGVVPLKKLTMPSLKSLQDKIIMNIKEYDLELDVQTASVNY